MKKKLSLLFWATIFTCCLSVHAQIITTVAGNGTIGYSGDGGPATSAQFSNPVSVALDAAGNMYVADFYNHRIRKINAATNIITTIAGTGTAGFSGDGGPAVNAELNNPADLCADAAGNIYFTDNQNFRVRKIEAATGIISTVAGNGSASYAGETILAINAGIHYPNGLAVDANNLYISLFSKQRICKVNLATGILSTIGGTGVNGYSGDGGPAINANFGYPAGLSASATGDVYVADYNNNRIRKIDAAGIVTTVAGNGTATYSGDGALATTASINLPTGVSVNAAGDIFIADRSNNRIRKVEAATGIINTVAGSGVPGYGGDGGSAISPCTKLADPHKVRVDAAGNMFIADQSNSRIRKVDTAPVSSGLPTINIAASATTACPGAPVTFSSVITNGGANPFYQWKKNGTITGTNSPSYSAASLNNGDIITCELTANTACGVVTVVSNSITITIAATIVPAITISPNPATACQGSAITFTATAVNGGSAPVYQWQVNGINAGTNNPVFISSTLSNGDLVKCILTSNQSCAVAGPVNSNTIIISFSAPVTPAVSITATATSICLGGSVSFTASTTNSGNNPAYQWKINNVNSGTNNAVFTTVALQNNDVVSCSIIVDPTATCITTNSANSNQIIITVSTSPAPVITIMASNNFICPGIPVTFTATAQNAGNTPSYAWKLNGSNTGTNNAVYTNSNLFNGDQVMCVLTANNISCPSSSSASSNIITMAVKSLPVISISPVNATVFWGKQVQLTTVVNSPVNSFQWTPANLLVNPLSLSPLTKPLDSTTRFFLSVTNTDGCTNNESVQIKVYSPLEMPSAFTPNNDGLNDVFRIPPGVLLKLAEFSVYDRWGNKIFTTTDITKGWDGQFAGKSFNTGSFVYVISGVLEGKKIFLTDSFTLIR
jgi:gliding motility-associated-like protein